MKAIPQHTLDVQAITTYVSGVLGTRPRVSMAVASQLCGRSAAWLRSHLNRHGLPVAPVGRPSHER